MKAKLVTTKVTEDTLKDAKKIAAEVPCKQYEAIEAAVKEKLILINKSKK